MTKFKIAKLGNTQWVSKIVTKFTVKISMPYYHSNS